MTPLRPSKIIGIGRNYVAHAMELGNEMPAVPMWFRGRAHYREFMAGVFERRGRRWRLVPTRANGQLAFAHYASLHDEPFTMHAVGVIAFRGTEIAELTYFRSPDMLARFELPETL